MPWGVGGFDMTGPGGQLNYKKGHVKYVKASKLTLPPPVSSRRTIYIY